MTNRRGGLLRHRDFRLLWIGETVSQAGSSMALVVVPLLAVTTLRASTFDVAALSAAGSAPWLLIGLPAGAWVDRLPARSLMISCDVVAALLYASLPVAAWAGLLTVGQLAIVALLAGACNVLFATAYQVYLPELVSAGDLVEGNAKLQGSASAAAIGGRGAAGVAAEALGAATAVLFNAASFLVSAACLLRIGPGPARPATAERTTTLRQEIASGARFIARDPYLRPLTIYAAVSNLAYAGYSSLVVVFLVRVAGLGAATVGLLMAAGGIGGTAGALVARRLGRALGTARALLLTTLTDLFGLLIPLTRAGPGIICYAVGIVVVTAGLLIGNILVAAFRQSYCPPGMLGRAVAGMRFLAFGAIPVGALLAGTLGTALGVRNALWCVLGAGSVTGALLYTPAIVSRRDLPPGESYDVQGIAGAARSLKQREPHARERRGQSLRVLGARGTESDDEDVGYRRTRPMRRPPSQRSWRRRIALTIIKIVLVVIVVFAAALALLYVFTPSAGQATALAAVQARERHIGYPGPPAPKYFAEALVATEDHRFYSDPGVDPIALARVTISWVTGHTDGGGSTIDQQLAKNLYTSGHSSLPQIVEQVVLAVKLNRAYSRAEILRLYAEVAYYGHDYYGLEAASCGYFGRQPSQLTLVQAAMLAGVVNAPTYDDPLVYPAQARARLVHVIDRMAAVGYLTSAQQAAALKAPLDLSAVRGCP